MQAGDRWILEGGKVHPGDGRLCAYALSTVFPQVERILANGGALPQATLHCGGSGCQVAFRLEEARAADLPAPVTALSGTGRTGPFLARLSPALAGKIVAATVPLSFKPGESILQEGVAGEALCIIGDGEVEVVRKHPDTGAETVLAVLGWGECFGEMSLVTGEPTSATVRARGSVKILSLPRDALEKQLALSDELNRVFAHLLADRLRALNLTLQAERGRGIRGKLSMLTVGELVQTLHASRRTGTLTVTRKEDEAKLYFVKGSLKAAESGPHDGDEAFYMLTVWPDGDFAFVEENPKWPDESAVTLDTMGLLMESMRRFDETQRLPKPSNP
ncbi:MAG: cyclic nucleotide-binding domain-containing protein [Planctomycetota bacterium]|nr:cyclic nucleotide-binding domain-containing protein [Planctomycetota bacterium]